MRSCATLLLGCRGSDSVSYLSRNVRGEDVTDPGGDSKPEGRSSWGDALLELAAALANNNAATGLGESELAAEALPPAPLNSFCNDIYDGAEQSAPGAVMPPGVQLEQNKDSNAHKLRGT